jgi:hypothetical protein
MALNRKTFKKAAGDAPSGNLPSGYFNTVTYTGNGGTQKIGGYINRAALFNGSSSKIDLPNLGISGAATRTISAWINVNSLSAAQTIFQFGASAAGERFGFAIDTAGKLYVEYYGRDAITSSAQITTGSWFNVAVTYNGGAIETATNTQIYVNGSAVAMSTTGIQTGVANTGDSNYGIGYRRPSTSQYFNGKIDQVRIFNKALSSTERTTLYGETFASASKSVTDIFDDNSGVALYQLDGNANDTGGNYNGTATNVTYQDATNFSPDLVWVKSRSTAKGHILSNSMSSNNATNSLALLSTQNNEREYTATETNGLYIRSLDSNGFTVGSSDFTGASGTDYVAWCFNAGGSPTATNSAGAGNVPTSGSVMIDGSSSSAALAGNVEAKKMSVNTNAQFSIVEFTSQAGATNQVPHGLNGTPDLFIFKRTDSTENWWTYTQVIDGSLDYFVLNGSDSKSDSSETAPTATTVYQPTSSSGRDYILYSFKNVDGIQKVGTYTGNGTSQSIVTDFEVGFVLIKSSTSTQNWMMYDSKRSGKNYLIADSSGAEGASSSDLVSFNSNGFTVANSNSENQSGQTFIYLAIAADPDTTTPTVENSFDVVTYTGDGNNRNIDVGFKPDFVWIKERADSAGYWHYLFDSVRGGNKPIFSNATNAESVNDNNGYLSSFNDNGFSITSGSIGMDSLNGSGKSYVAWVWKAGDHDDNLPQINTEGTIDSVVSVNAEAGFSIVKYTGNGTAGATISHGLSSAPELILLKNLDVSDNWAVYNSASGATKYMNLNQSYGAGTATTIWNDTEPTSTVFSVGTSTDVNGSGNNLIAYCFTSITGYQKVGSYVGSNSSSKVVATGFQPRFLLIKSASSNGNFWNMFDSVRTSGTDGKGRIYPNSSAAEDGTLDISFDSTSFEILTSNSDINGNNTYIYLAIK